MSLCVGLRLFGLMTFLLKETNLLKDVLQYL